MITKEPQRSDLIFINRDENNTSIRKKSFCDVEAARHKAEPFGMAVAVLAVNEGIVVDEVFVAGVVRRIDINYVDFAFVCVS